MSSDAYYRRGISSSAKWMTSKQRPGRNARSGETSSSGRTIPDVGGDPREGKRCIVYGSSHHGQHCQWESLAVVNEGEEKIIRTYPRDAIAATKPLHEQAPVPVAAPASS